ncbi:MAG: OmpA family protein [Bacteroidia bacterium]|nr:OmpA family protein [Bacteroidia bacterium]
MKFSTTAFKWIVIGVAATSLTSCVSKKKYEEALTRAAAEKSALESQLSASQAESDKLRGQITTMESNLNMKSEEIVKLSEQIKTGNTQITTLQNAIKEAFSTYDPNDIKVEERNGKLYITMANSILFEPGSADLMKGSDSIIKVFAGVLKENGALSIMVEGHTDSDPMQSNKRKFSDNWSMSAARALTVVRELEKGGVEGARLTASGKGSAQPIADNATEAGKEKNRRIEFVVVPKIDGLYRMYKEGFSGTAGGMK